MSDHDPLCPWLEALKLPERFPDLGGRVGIPDADQCDYEPLIAKVRADERDKTMQRADIRAAIDMAVAAERERIAQALESQVIDAASGVIAVRWAARIARDPALRAGSTNEEAR